jgi:3-oxocholest-4-en-26-oate---CoA ligase
LAGCKKPRRVAVVPEVQRLNTGKADLGWAGRQFGRCGARPRDVPAPTGP